MKEILIMLMATSLFITGCSENKKKFLPFTVDKTESAPATTTAPINAATNVTQATPTCSTSPCTTGSVVTITVNFTEAVLVNGVPTLILNNGKTATYVSGSGTNNLVFTYTVAANDDVIALNYQDTNSLVLSNNSTITLVANGSNADRTLPPLTGPGSMPAANTVVIDTALPTINSVSASTTNGTYTKDGKIYVTVTLSEPVLVTGTPTLALNTGNVGSGTANYVSGSGSNTLVFEYTVRSGDKIADLNYVATNSLSLNGGTINDAANNVTTLTLPATGAATSLGGSKDIALDTTPRVASISTTTANGTYAAGATINFTITFTDAVTTTGTNTLTLANGRTATCTNVTNSTTMSCTYIVQQGDTSTDLTYQSTTSLGGTGTIVSAANPGLAGVKTLPDPTVFQTSHDIVIVALPSISFTAGITTSVSEGVAGGNYAVGFTLSAANAADVTFTVTTGDVTAFAGNDFTGINQTFTIPAGQTSGTLNIPITNDILYEGSESFTVNLSNASANAILSGSNTQTVTINDNDAAPTLSLSASTYSGAEGNTITVTINKTGASAVGSTVTLATAITGTGPTHAISGTDYTAVSQIINIPASPGNSTVTFDLSTTADTLFENSETFTVAISGPSNATLTGTTSATVTITNDDTAPTASLTAGTTNSVGEGVGNYVLSVTLSAASGVATTITVNTTAGTATAGGTDFGTLTNATITIPAGSTTGTINIPINDDTIFEGNEAFTVTISGPTITGGATQTVTITDNELGLLSATTMDSDNDGLLDSYKLVFSEAVNDNTFPGYAANGNGSAQTAWLIAGYTGLVLSNGTAAPEADTLNDNTIYLRFTEGGTGDTGAKPDLTTTATPGLTGTSGSTLRQVTTVGLTEQDGAKAIIMSAVGLEGSTSVTVTFSEAVYTATGTPACATAADITLADTTFTNGNGAGAAYLSAVSEACGTDKIITYTTNSALLTTDNQDTIAYAANTVFDSANNQISTVAKSLTITPNTVPALTLLEELDTDYDGKIDTLQLTFDKAMTDSTISGNLAQCTVGGLAVIGFNTGTTPNDSVVRLTVSGSVAAGTDFKTAIYTAGSWQSTLGGNLPSFNYSAHNGSGVPRDAAAPVIISAVAADPAPNTADVDSGDTLTVTFSEAINNFGTINNTNITSLLSLSGGQTWPTVTTANWSNSNKTVTLTFGGSGVIADDTVITAVNTTNKFVDSPNNFYASSATMTGSFTTDTLPPYLAIATDITASGATASTVLVKFSESVMTGGGVNAGDLAANYTVNGMTVASVTSVSSTTFKVTLTGLLTSGTEYTITADNGSFSGGQAIKDLAGNNLTSPNALTFIANDEMRIVQAEATSTTQIKVYYSRLVANSGNGSGACADSTSCAAKYYITPSLGTIASVTVSDNVATFTITGSTMKGVAYTLVAANGVQDDPTAASASFDTGATDGITDLAGSKTLSGNPKDRISFTGKGTAVNDFSDGWYMSDPFADGSVFAFTFKFKTKVYVGPNVYNNTTLRLDPDGKNVISNTYKMKSATWKAIAINCPATSGFGYGFDGSNNTSCDRNLIAGDYSGGKYEEGLVGYTSLNLTGGDILAVGPMVNNATNAYVTQDTDNQLDMQAFALRSFTGGGNTKSIQAYFSDANNLYMGHASNHGTQAPILVRMPVTFASSVITNIDDANNNSDSLNLDAGSNPISKSTGTNTHVNSADAIGVDSFIATALNGQTKRMYLGNSVGIGSSTDLIAFGSPVASEPTNMKTVGQTNLVLPGIKSGGSFPEGLLKVSPGQRGVPFLKLHNGKLYAARNVSVASTHTNGAITEANKTPNYAEVYVCGTPSAGTAGSKYCNGADWSLVFTTNSAISDGTRFDSSKSNNIAISMFEISPTGNVYLGFDSPSGFRVYRNAVGNSSDITNSGWTQEGPSTGSKDGFGDSTYNRIQSSVVAQDKNSIYYTYITVGGYDTTNLWHKPIQVYRQADDGAARVAFGPIMIDSNLLAYLAKTKKNVPVTLLFGIILASVIGIGLRRKYLKDHHLI